MHTAAIGIVLTLIFQMVSSANSARGADTVQASEEEERDSYTIYSILLKQDVNRLVIGIGRETIANHSGGYDESPCMPEALPKQQKIYQPLIADFKRRNVQPVLLQEKFALPKYRLLTAGEIYEIARRLPVVAPPPGTPLPERIDPSLRGIGNVHFLSRVGFSPNHLRALVYMATRDEGQFYFLIKHSGKWTLDKHYRGTNCYWVA